MKKLSLRNQLLLLVSCIVLAGFTLTLAFLTHRAANLQQATALHHVQEMADKYSKQASAPLLKALDTSGAMANALVAMQQTGHADRTLANQMLREVLVSNPGFISAWTIWEPNAFDGRDAEYVDTEGHDSTGRYVTAVMRGEGGRVALGPVAGYETEAYYQSPKATGKRALMEPFKYNLAGKEILQTAIAVPIQINGRFVGVAGVGVALSALQELAQGIQVYETGYGSILSNGGVFLGDKDPGNVGKQLSTAMGFEPHMVSDLLAHMRAGKRHQIVFNDPLLDNAQATVVQVPMNLEGIDTPWVFLATVPTEKIQEEIVALQWMAVGLGLLSIVLTSMGLAVAVDRLVLRPIGGEPSDAAALAKHVAQGDLSHTIAVRAGDDASLMYQLHRMQESLQKLVSQVREGAQSVASASAQISSGNQDLSSRTESQASALEETASSMEELGSTVRQNADHAMDASKLATDASSIARQGGESVGKVIQTMQGIDESSRRIADIIGVIDGIAFQTNILALNAAVEAARAGEQGRGFAVVAGEVRSLAQRSAEAAKEIKQLINDSVQRVTIGSDQVNEAGEMMERVVHAIHSVSTLFQEISAASREQSAGVSQVGEAVTNMDQATQQNAALVEEMAAAAQSLSLQAEGLVNTVSVFKLKR
ncbi:MAG: hypothetical protein KBT18_11230 [Comamonas sp.]|nr:hypothetical protein [Candidatus Comamonas equi]